MLKVHSLGLACLTISFATAVVSMGVTANTGYTQMKEINNYPFVATSVRAAKIRNRYQEIKAGMSPAEVLALLDEPDEIRPLYEPRVKNGKIIGYTYWYVIQRLAKNGSVNEKQELLVRVSFSLNDRVSKVDAWGL